VPAKQQVIGFDLKGTPVGALPLPERIAGTIVTEKKDLTLADYMDGVFPLIDARGGHDGSGVYYGCSCGTGEA